MIKIEILSANDSDLIGEHYFNYDFISIGTTVNDRIPLKNKDKDFRLCFKLRSNDKILIYALPKNKFYKSLDKKISGNKLHLKNDLVETENVLIKVIDFHFEQKTNSSIKIDSIIEAAEDEFLSLEKAKDVI